MKIIFIFSCSGMFRDVPECSGIQIRNVHGLQSQTKVVGKVLYNLTVVHFNPFNRKIPPVPPIQCWDPGGGRKRTGEKGNLPNTFDDDCRYKVQTRNYGVSIKHGLQTVYIKTAFKFASSCRRSRWSNNWKVPSPAGRMKENRTL